MSKLKKNFDAVGWIGIINAWLGLDNVLINVRGGADKSLARPTSRCRRTESIVSLERGVCLCAELQVFSCYRGWKDACQATRAISTTSRRELSSSFLFSARQSAEENSRHSDRNIRGTCTIECKNPLENFSPWFFGIKTASSSLIIFQRAKLSTRDITDLCWCNWRVFWRTNAAGRSPRCLVLARQCPGSPGTCNPEETGLSGLPVSWSPTLFSGPGAVGLPPVPWTDKTIERSPFFVRHGGHCCRGDLVGRTTFWIFFEWFAKVRATG